ncbi:hypothetical protein BVX95_02165 [archaeon D22]|nr:hypothetical protein BVX95_02165 [archaeon D22]
MKITNKDKHLFFGSLVGVILYVIFQLVPFFICKDDFGCLFFIILPQLLGFFLTNLVGIVLSPTILLIFNGILFAGLGALIGWLVYYFKNKK